MVRYTKKEQKKRISWGKDWLPLSEALAQKGYRYHAGRLIDVTFEDTGIQARLNIEDATGKLYIGIQTQKGYEPVALRIQEKNEYNPIAELKKIPRPAGSKKLDKFDAWFELDTVPQRENLWLEVETHQKAIAPAAVKSSRPIGGRSKGVA